MDAKDAYVLFGFNVGINRCRDILRQLQTERNEEGELIIDPESMPPAKKVIVPTKIFCSKYKIPLPRKKGTPEATN